MKKILSQFGNNIPLIDLVKNMNAQNNELDNLVEK